MANASGAAQTLKATAISVIPYQGDEHHVWLLLADAGAPVPAGWFTDSSSPGEIIQNYKIYEVTNANSSIESFNDVSSQFLDMSGQIQIRLKSRMTVPLRQPLHSDRSYLIEAKDAHGNVLNATIAASPTLASSDAKHLRNALYVNANVPLKTTYTANEIGRAHV